MLNAKLIWILIFGVPAGVAAVGTAVYYQQNGHLPFQQPPGIASGPSVEGDDEEVAALPASVPAGDQQMQTGSDTSGTSETVVDADPDSSDAPQEVDGPSFDVVGVEATGETVVAGRSDAGAIVALVANGKVVGKSIANKDGEWTIILDEPLEPGDYDVGLEVQDEQGETLQESEQRVAVSLPEGGQEKPLVVLNTPDAPSEIVQLPAAAETEVAEAPGGPAPTDAAPVDVASSDPAPEVSAPVDTATVEAAPKEVEVAAVEAETAPTGEAVATETEVASVPVETTPVGSDTEEPEQTEVARAPASADVSDEPVAQPEVADKQPEITREEETLAAEVTPGPAEQPAIGDETEAVAETAAIEAAEEPTVAALPDEGAGSPQPPAASETAGAPAVEPVVETETTVAAVETGETPAAVSEPQETEVTVEAVESEPDKVFVAGTGKPGSSVRVYVDEEFQGEAKVGSSGRWLVEGEKNVSEGDVEVRADLLANDGNTVDARAAVTFEKEAEQQIVLTKVVAAGEGSGSREQGASVNRSLPVVIIRKGDNLWRISRRLYGNGIRYTTIYQANKSQIRNPNLIYPGQVFLTPAGDLSWAPEDAENG